jgi:hypothetical protein
VKFEKKNLNRRVSPCQLEHVRHNQNIVNSFFGLVKIEIKIAAEKAENKPYRVVSDHFDIEIGIVT